MTIHTLTQALDSNANNSIHINYLHSQNNEIEINFAELKQRALGILYHLQQQGMTAGNECIVVSNNNEFFIDAFWACLYGGIIPVPVAPPSNDEHRYKLLRIFNQLASPHIYTEEKLLNKLLAFCADKQLDDEAEKLRRCCFLIDSIDDISNAGTIHPSREEDTAFIQFSSGSTSEPKGVVLSHKNILTNINAIIEGAALSPADRLFSWMPLTHDMGMIGFHLTPIVVGINHTIMDTATFVRHPLLWLSSASEKKATILSSPNFGYKHFLKVFESRARDSFDLSSVRLIFNGAEPISIDICNQFLAAMHPYGLKQTAIFPVYGLAEASLAVTFPALESPIQTLAVKRNQLGVGDRMEASNDPAQNINFVFVGKPVQSCHVRITDNNNQVLTDGYVGRIQLKGDNVTSGYYRAEEINKQLITADGWLDTGDLGVFVNGQMIITGRIKDIIFVNGQNYYAHDLENILHPLDELELGKVVVDGVRRAGSSDDEVIVFILYRGEINAFLPLIQKIRGAINQTTGVEVAQVIPVKHIPKTTSGKVQRHLLGEACLNGAYNALIAEITAATSVQPSTTNHDSPTHSIEAKISEICHQVITDKTIGPDDNLFEIGISSLALAEIHEQLENDYPGKIDISDLFDHPTIRQLAIFLQQP